MWCIPCIQGIICRMANIDSVFDTLHSIVDKVVWATETEMVAHHALISDFEADWKAVVAFVGKQPDEPAEKPAAKHTTPSKS